MSVKAREILKKQRLGEILKSLDFIDDKKLEEILKQQKTSNMKLGEVLTSMGIVDKEVVLSLVGKQLGHPYVRLSDSGGIPEDVLKYIPKSIAQQHMLIPFDMEGDKLKVAMAEPQEEEVRAAISILTNLEVEVYITSEEEIIRAIKENYE
ncbi:MAG: hypothetical protein JXJ19_09570 [Elusimicrobia bacterium]|nr:hypothetical protein [Elusimicrobiota bacterium]